MYLESMKFGKEGRRILAPFADVSYYISSINPVEAKSYEPFDILWLKKEAEVIGYALIGKVEKAFFEGDDEAEEVYDMMENGKLYTHIPYFEIFSGYQNSGNGTAFFKLIKEQFDGEEIILFSTEDSYSFWNNNGFQSANYSDWWLTLSA